MIDFLNLDPAQAEHQGIYMPSTSGSWVMRTYYHRRSTKQHLPVADKLIEIWSA
jgi:hypothetical protein